MGHAPYTTPIFDRFHIMPRFVKMSKGSPSRAMRMAQGDGIFGRMCRYSKPRVNVALTFTNKLSVIESNHHTILLVYVHVQSSND